MNSVIEGKAYTLGDNVTAYQIIGKPRWPLGPVPAEAGKWVFEGAIPAVQDVEFGFRDMGYDIVVAGENFGGGGKSIEHPVAAIQGAGVKVILADSFDRYLFRNSINRGLPAILCPGITKLVHMGDRLSVDLISGLVKNVTTGESLQGAPLSDLVLKFAEAGGMLAYYRQNK